MGSRMNHWYTNDNVVVPYFSSKTSFSQNEWKQFVSRRLNDIIHDESLNIYQESIMNLQQLLVNVNDDASIVIARLFGWKQSNITDIQHALLSLWNCNDNQTTTKTTEKNNDEWRRYRTIDELTWYLLDSSIITNVEAFKLLQLNRWGDHVIEAAFSILQSNSNHNYKDNEAWIEYLDTLIRVANRRNVNNVNVNCDIQPQVLHFNHENEFINPKHQKEQRVRLWEIALEHIVEQGHISERAMQRVIELFEKQTPIAMATWGLYVENENWYEFVDTCKHMCGYGLRMKFIHVLNTMKYRNLLLTCEIDMIIRRIELEHNDTFLAAIHIYEHDRVDNNAARELADTIRRLLGTTIESYMNSSSSIVHQTISQLFMLELPEIHYLQRLCEERDAILFAAYSLWDDELTSKYELNDTLLRLSKRQRPRFNYNHNTNGEQGVQTEK